MEMNMIINYNFDYTMEGELKDIPNLMKEVFGSSAVQFYVTDESKKRLAESVLALEYKPKKAPKKKRKSSKWTQHISKVAKERGITYMEAIKYAKETYVKE